MQNIKQNRKQILFLIVVGMVSIFIGGFIIGLGFGRFFRGNALLSSFVEARLGLQKFTNPLLACDIANGRLNTGLAPFKREMDEYVKNILSKGDITDIAVYFRDLNDGPWIGVNEKKGFIPASLLKVPLAMVYYKKAESDPSILNKKIYFEKLFPIGDKIQLINPSEEIKIGNTYTIADLIERSIIYSDNQAAQILLRNIDGAAIIDIFKYLDVQFTKQDQTNLEQNAIFLSVRAYATFFRILFNTSYLNHEYSEKVLNFLSQSEFKEGLSAGVPSNLVVSHKFGETGDKNSGQLHDCGIIYFPNKPYLLCVMTRGKNIESLKAGISDLSALVYEEVSKQIEINSGN